MRASAKPSEREDNERAKRAARRALALHSRASDVRFFSTFYSVSFPFGRLPRRLLTSRRFYWSIERYSVRHLWEGKRKKSIIKGLCGEELSLVGGLPFITSPNNLPRLSEATDGVPRVLNLMARFYVYKEKNVLNA